MHTMTKEHGRASATPMLRRISYFKVVILGNIGDADDEHAHPAIGSMHDTGWDMNERAFADGVIHAIK